jgi:hypothetical protein
MNKILKIIIKIVYIITFVIILFSITLASISGIIQKMNILSMIFIVLFFLFGWNLGIILLINSIIAYLVYCKMQFLILTFLALTWVGYSVYLWLYRGFAI